MKRNWPEIFPELLPAGHARVDPDVQSLLDTAQEVVLPAGTTVFRQGDECSNYLLVVAGQVRVMTRAENGREIVLYRLGSGDSCVLTTSCLFGHRRYPAEGITDTEVVAIAIPAELFQHTIRQSDAFRRFVFASFSKNLGYLITLVEEVAFGRLDIRLTRYLLDHAAADNRLRITHQELATELGSAREVISRRLKDLEQRGMLELGRGSILIRDPNGLEAVASSG